ncbi:MULTISPECIES: MFS transporter [unclassified Pseudomonas]|uniref:MFS transporter n=1 Tax=unclassified Pseudomonas TaxID=196821 RepID=UPI000D38867A|nr:MULTISPECIES: MFS transporter [unclassified Pseudomonas]RAU44033.1 MFS transporter [Pseudomonas sp. RIT 409]RAU54778.1 MFS transporter [Pseudomonas sp. RIT 412]
MSHDRQSNGALRILSVAYFVQATGALSVIGSLEPIGQEWHLGHAETAYLMTAFGVTFAVAAPLLQVLSGHIPRQRQVLLGLLGFGLGALLFAAAPNYTVLILSRMIMGLGAAFIGPVLAALGSSLVTSERQASAIAIVLLGLSVAGLVGIPLSSWVAYQVGVRSLFLAISAAALITALLVAWQVPNRSPGQRVAFRTLILMLTQRHSLSVFGVAFFATAAVYTTYSFIGPVVHDVYNGSAHDVSVALLVLGVAGVIGNLLVTRLSLRYTADRLLITSMLVLALLMLMLGAGPHRLGWLFAMLVMWAIATDVVWPSQQRRVIEHLADYRGVALALTAAFVFCGIGAGAALAGWVYPVGGLAGLMITSTLLLMLACACLLISARLKPLSP